MRYAAVVVPSAVLATAIQTSTLAPNPRLLQPTRPMLIAHRGASAYAPEHTLAAYRLAIEQGADYVEQDLAVTRDGVLVCLHDDTLERTTDVETRFPDRGRDVVIDGRPERQWPVADFTLAEIKTLDAGSWFDPRFADERVPTFGEAIALVGDRAGIFPELKSPALYRDRGIDIVALFAAALARHGLDGAPPDRLYVQTFDVAAARALAEALPSVARVLLVNARSAEANLSPGALGELGAFLTGVGPDKRVVDGRPDLVAAAHAAGLSVWPWTFRASDDTRFADVTEEMAYYLTDLGVDGLFTDNPDRFPDR